MNNCHRININKTDLISVSALALIYIVLAGVRMPGTEISIVFFFLVLSLARIRAEVLLKYFFLVFLFNGAHVNLIIIWIIFLRFLTEKQRTWGIRSRVKSFGYLFLGITVVSGIFSDAKISAVKEIFVWIYILGVVICCQYVTDMHCIYKAYVAACMIISAIWLADKFIPDLIENMAVFRIPDDNNSSMLLLCGIFVSRYLGEEIKGRFSLMRFTEVVLILGLLAIGSRGIQVLAIFFYFTVLCRSLKYRRSAVILLGAVSASAVFLFSDKGDMLIKSIGHLLRSVINADFYSNRVRIEMYHIILTKMLPDHLLIGVGPGNFLPVYQEYAAEFIPNHAHSIYLQILIEDGIWGFLILTGLMAYLTGLFLREIKSSDKNMAFCALCFLSVFLIYGCVEYVWNNSNVLASFAGFMTVSEFWIRKRKRQGYMLNEQKYIDYQISSKNRRTGKADRRHSGRV